MSQNIKQVIIIRNDLNMRKGKMVAQGAHASMGAIFSIAHDFGSGYTIPIDKDLRYWFTERFAKICVRCDSEEEILELERKAKEKNLIHSLITDSGFTEFHGVPTITALAIGPGKSSEIDEITGHLKLL